MLPSGMSERSAPLRSILRAAAQVLSFDSAHLARLTDDRQSLALAIAVAARAVPEFEAVETALGCQISGLQVPIWVTESVLWRALREERLIISHDVTEVAGGALPAEIVRQIAEIIGPRTFAIAPIIGRSGALGVMFVEKVGQVELSADERGLLLIYAERVGAELESEALLDEASRLERLGQVAAPPPTLWTCAPGVGPEAGTGALMPLLCRGGAVDGHPLYTVLGLTSQEALWSLPIQLRLLAGETVTLSVNANNGPPPPPHHDDALLRTAAGLLGTPVQQPPEPVAPSVRPLRVTLRAGPAPIILCAVEDLSFSERLRRETLLAREHLAKVMHSVGDAILTLDGEGVIRQANEGSRAVLGLSPAQLCGQSAAALAATDRGREQLAGLRQRLQKTGFAEKQLRLLRGDPTQGRQSFPAHLSALLLADEHGRPAGAVWRIHDQTERKQGDAEGKRLRLRLLHSERLSALGEMAARIAHEVRNPLVSIGAAAQVVAEELPLDSPVRGEALAIGNEVRRLDNIITDFLRFARPRRPGGLLAEVDRVLCEVVDLMRKKAGAVTLKLSLPVAAGVGVGSGPGAILARIDPDGLRQILWNVLLNACEASQTGEAARNVVECEVRRQKGRPGQDERVLITVADHGPGVSDSVRRRVFDPFFSTKARGTGLGLSICRQIVEEHGGRIRLLNRQGGGTRVVIELPAAKRSMMSMLLETAS